MDSLSNIVLLYIGFSILAFTFFVCVVSIIECKTLKSLIFWTAALVVGLGVSLTLIIRTFWSIFKWLFL